jgi:hypothetical protein
MAATIETVFVLMIVFQVKHFAADYIFQYNYMLKKVSPGWDFLIPLVLHCFVHSFLTLLICLFFTPHLWWLSLVDFVIHFFLDRLRSGPRYLGRFKDPHKSIFWWILGADQMLHHLTHIGLTWYMMYH